MKQSLDISPLLCHFCKSFSFPTAKKHDRNRENEEKHNKMKENIIKYQFWREENKIKKEAHEKHDIFLLSILE